MCITPSRKVNQNSIMRHIPLVHHTANLQSHQGALLGAWKMCKHRRPILGVVPFMTCIKLHKYLKELQNEVFCLVGEQRR